MKWIFISPHLDDVVFSCGGFIWEKVAQGDAIEVWTIFAGIPSQDEFTPFAQSLHARWGVGMEAIEMRRDEDAKACSMLGASYRHFDFLDCIYRFFPGHDVPVVEGEEDLFQSDYHLEPQLFNQISESMCVNIPEEVQFVGPLALGDHIDHQLVKCALHQVRPAACFFADYPYAGKIEDIGSVVPHRLSQKHFQPISPSALKAWQEAIASYQTQISTFWPSIPEMENALEAYWRKGGGCVLWGAAQGNAC
jgi:LmbE family N-acetylglucosaminyl deacetylase